MTELIKELILAMIQGITEPLPISSSGHMILFESLLGIDIPGYNFEAFVNFGSFLAIILFYKKFLMKSVGNTVQFIFGKKEYKSDFIYWLKVATATVPIGIIGILFGDELFMKSPLSVSIALVVTGLALFYVSKFGNGTKSNFKYLDAFFVGIAQALALIPGISRSGATVLTSLRLGYKIEDSLRFSFMMYLPISFLIGVFSILQMITDHYFKVADILVLGTSALFTYLALGWLIKLVQKHNLKYFAYYCLVIGAIGILFS